jgi:hypothetical protein
MSPLKVPPVAALTKSVGIVGVPVTSEYAPEVATVANPAILLAAIAALALMSALTIVPSVISADVTFCGAGWLPI